jgi:hypothetical protein
LALPKTEQQREQLSDDSEFRNEVEHHSKRLASARRKKGVFKFATGSVAFN